MGNKREERMERKVGSLLYIVGKIVIGKIVKQDFSVNKKFFLICRLLEREVSHYDWVGFYFVYTLNKEQLILGPYAGATTDHMVIPYGKGICGQVAETEKMIVVQDVSKECNYLSCSRKVKSEIVVPIFKDNKFVGVLDIDSHSISPFTEADEAFLGGVCKIIAELF